MRCDKCGNLPSRKPLVSAPSGQSAVSVTSHTHTSDHHSHTQPQTHIPALLSWRGPAAEFIAFKLSHHANLAKPHYYLTINTLFYSVVVELQDCNPWRYCFVFFRIYPHPVCVMAAEWHCSSINYFPHIRDRVTSWQKQTLIMHLFPAAEQQMKL